MDKTPLINESDCCGNGCVHCVLNNGLRKTLTVDNQGMLNVVTNFQKFRLLGQRFHNPKGENTNNGSRDPPEVIELHFRVADLPNNESDYILDIPVGYHLMMRTKLTNGLVWLRPYSPFWVDDLAMEFKILVNLTPNGHMSRYIISLQPGDFVEFRGPIGGYEYSESGNKEQCIFVITQGVAIASTLRIVKRILDDEEDFSRVVQLACFKDLNHVYFRDTLREFSRNWNYTNRIYLSNQRCPPEMCKEVKCTGKCIWFRKNLLYKELVHLRRLTESELVDICKDVKKGTKFEFIIAGGKAFQDAFSKFIICSNFEVLDKTIFLL